MSYIKICQLKKIAHLFRRKQLLYNIVNFLFKLSPQCAQEVRKQGRNLPETNLKDIRKGKERQIDRKRKGREERERETERETACVRVHLKSCIKGIMDVRKNYRRYQK